MWFDYSVKYSLGTIFDTIGILGDVIRTKTEIKRLAFKMSCMKQIIVESLDMS